VKPRPTVPQSRLSPRLYLSCLPFLRLARLPLSRQISFRQGRAGVKPPPLVPPGLPSITGSCALTLRHRRSNNQSPPRDSPDGHGSPRPPTRGPPVLSTRSPPPPLGMPLPRLSLFRRFLACKAARTTRRTSLRCRHSVPPAREPCGPPQRFSLSYSISQTAPSVSGCCSLADKGRLRRDNDRTLPLARKSTPTSVDGLVTSSGRAAHLVNGESSTQIYVPLLMRPWIMQACHATISCHLGVARTLSMLDLFYGRIGMSVSTRCWLRHYLKCQARKCCRQRARWSILSLPLPSDPGIAISVDYFGPLPVAPKGDY